MATAYLATAFNNIMDFLQLVFAFVNAPLFATFLLGMFWRRATGHGAFVGLLLGTSAAAIHHGVSLPAHAEVGIKGGWLSVLTHYPSEMAQNFWTAIWAWSTCFLVSIAVSLFTRHDKSDEQLKGLVYALTPRPHEPERSWWKTTPGVGAIILGLALLLNLAFW